MIKKFKEYLLERAIENGYLAKYFIVFIFFCICLLLYTIHDQRQCNTFASTGTSHIRMNNCTGEAHIIVRGPNGFEWQRVND